MTQQNLKRKTEYIRASERYNPNYDFEQRLERLARRMLGELKLNKILLEQELNRYEVRK